MHERSTSSSARLSSLTSAALTRAAHHTSLSSLIDANAANIAAARRGRGGHASSSHRSNRGHRHGHASTSSGSGSSGTRTESRSRHARESLHSLTSSTHLSDLTNPRVVDDSARSPASHSIAVSEDSYVSSMTLASSMDRASHTRGNTAESLATNEPYSAPRSVSHGCFSVTLQMVRQRILDELTREVGTLPLSHAMWTTHDTHAPNSAADSSASDGLSRCAKVREHHERALRIAFGDPALGSSVERTSSGRTPPRMSGHQGQGGSGSSSNNNNHHRNNQSTSSHDGMSEDGCRRRANQARDGDNGAIMSGSEEQAAASHPVPTDSLAVSSNLVADNGSDNSHHHHHRSSSSSSINKKEENEEEEEDITVSSVEFSLLCPYSRLPMRVPVRSRLCRHVQCCDLDSWMVLLNKGRSLRDPTGPCPVCETRIAASSLEVDYWMLQVQRAMPPGTKLVVLTAADHGRVYSADVTREQRKQLLMTEIIDATQVSASLPTEVVHDRDEDVSAGDDYAAMMCDRVEVVVDDEEDALTIRDGVIGMRRGRGEDAAMRTRWGCESDEHVEEVVSAMREAVSPMMRREAATGHTEGVASAAASIVKSEPEVWKEELSGTTAAQPEDGVTGSDTTALVAAVVPTAAAVLLPSAAASSSSAEAHGGVVMVHFVTEEEEEARMQGAYSGRRWQEEDRHHHVYSRLGEAHAGGVLSAESVLYRVPPHPSSLPPSSSCAHDHDHDLAGGGCSPLSSSSSSCGSGSLRKLGGAVAPRCRRVLPTQVRHWQLVCLQCRLLITGKEVSGREEEVAVSNVCRVNATPLTRARAGEGCTHTSRAAITGQCDACRAEDAVTLVRWWRMVPDTTTPCTRSTCVCECVTMERTAEGVTILCGVDAAADYLLRAGFHRSAFVYDGARANHALARRAAAPAQTHTPNSLCPVDTTTCMDGDTGANAHTEAAAPLHLSTPPSSSSSALWCTAADYVPPTWENAHAPECSRVPPNSHTPDPNACAPVSALGNTVCTRAGVWVSTLPFTRIELDFLEACCQQAALGAVVVSFDGMTVPPLFRIPARRQNSSGGGGGGFYSTAATMSSQAVAPPRVAYDPAQARFTKRAALTAAPRYDGATDVVTRAVESGGARRVDGAPRVGGERGDFLYARDIVSPVGSMNTLPSPS